MIVEEPKNLAEILFDRHNLGLTEEEMRLDRLKFVEMNNAGITENQRQWRLQLAKAFSCGCRQAARNSGYSTPPAEDRPADYTVVHGPNGTVHVPDDYPL